MEKMFEAMGLPSNIVYMRSVDLDDLPSELREDVDENQPLFAVYDENGNQIALFADKTLIKDLAREHAFNLHSVN